MGVFGNGTKIDAANRRTQEWIDYAKTLEAKLDATNRYAQDWKARAEELKQALQEKIDMYKRLSDRFIGIYYIVEDLTKRPVIHSIRPIQNLLAVDIQFTATAEGWSTAKRRKENIRLIAEAEYSAKVFLDPCGLLNGASVALKEIASCSDNNQSEKLMALASQVQNAGKILDDEYMEQFLDARTKELQENLRYENDGTAIPIIDSIPPARQIAVNQTNVRWNFIENKEDAKDLLIQDPK